MPVTTSPADRFAIQDLMARYAWALDTRDHEMYASLFTPDGVFVERGVRWQGREVLAEHIRDLSTRQARGNRHHNTQILFEEGDDTRVRMRSYSLHVNQPEAGSTGVVRMQGWYRDTVVKVDGVWYFAERIWDEWNPDDLPAHRPPPR